jgi:hypothetical protein
MNALAWIGQCLALVLCAASIAAPFLVIGIALGGPTP